MFGNYQNASSPIRFLKQFRPLRGHYNKRWVSYDVPGWLDKPAILLCQWRHEEIKAVRDMGLRPLRERALQTLCFEIIGLALVVPVYSFATDRSSTDSMLLMVLLSLVILLWCPVHNTVFDVVELRLSNRKASDRPHWLRIAHAVSHETTAVFLTCPIVMLVGRMSLGEALAINIGLTVFYTAYAYTFHLIYDQLRPVQTDPSKLSNARDHRLEVSSLD